MAALLLGLLACVVLLFALRAFAAAPVTTVKSLLVWVGVLAGLSLAALLLFSGRGAAMLAVIPIAGPILWQHWRSESARPAAAGRTGPMTREEAYAVLGLQPGASRAEIRAAYRRVMRAAHPDSGGSDWLAARVNQAKDLLLGR